MSDLLDFMREAGERAVRDVLRGIDAGVQQKLTGTRSGRQYPGLPNRSSAPGEPPATQSGRLKTSRTIRFRGLRGEIVYDAGYAGYLETGTSKMAPRPFVKPVLDELESMDILGGL